MHTETITLLGTLRADGTVTLQDKPSLRPGPVEVTLRAIQAGSLPSGGWLDYLRQARADLESAGHPFRTKEAIDADLAELRADRDDLPERARDDTAESAESA
jgi:hypothetical protein